MMLDIKEVIKGLQIERECVSRDCDRDCGKCNIVQERDWLLAVYDDAIELLKEQEVKTGHWIDSAGNDKCSNCGTEYSDLYPDYGNTHFCPNCGAKMEGRSNWNEQSRTN